MRFVEASLNLILQVQCSVQAASQPSASNSTMTLLQSSLVLPSASHGGVPFPVMATGMSRYPSQSATSTTATNEPGRCSKRNFLIMQRAIGCLVS